MEPKGLEPAFRNLAKWSAVLTMVVIVYPWIFLIPGSGEPYGALTHGALLTTHTHLGGNTFLLFMVGFLFSHTTYGGAKKWWPTIGAIALLCMALGLFLGNLAVIIVDTIIFSVCLLVMAVGILLRTP